MALTLGPFDLVEPVGKGGMGVVWRGTHREQGIPVAVKILKPTDMPDADALRSFRQEVRAVSALDHPSIVRIFDHGEVPAELAAASGGRIDAGAPYLVTEFASGGTLRRYGRGPKLRTGPSTGPRGEPSGPVGSQSGAIVAPLGWRALRSILLALLDALAHAHARGVLHRDLKPDNVLMCTEADSRPGIKLTDFGIARPLDDEYELEEKPVGTPQYMAPEQLRNDRDAFGPHTDLYAFGHLGWRLATGRLVWHGLSGPSLMYAQLRKPPPPFKPAFPVPEALEELLRTLLAKEPHQRFRRAADAALALSRIGDLDDDAANGAPLLLETATLRVVLGGRGEPHERTPEIRPALPETWRVGRPRAGPRLVGTGLGLFGVRPVPFVGREGELDRIWKALGAVHREGRARVAVVRGPRGVGRSRLVQWVAERAHEVGGASVLQARLGPESPLDRFLEPLVRFLKAHPLSAEDGAARWGELLAGLDLEKIHVADAIALLLDPEELELPESQRWGIFRRTLEILATDRPLVLVVDDAQTSPRIWRFARQLLATQDTRPAPILVLLATTEDANPLSGSPGVDSMILGPFQGDARHAFVRALAGLAPALEARVAEVTAGNPLHGVQLVADWVDRERLRPSPTGYVLAPGAAEPVDLDAVWDRRVRRVVEGLEAPAMLLLERAAVLGDAVDAFEWQAASDDPTGEHAALGRAMFHPRQARLRARLMERLFELGLALPTESGLVFRHGGLRAALLGRARDAGRLREHAYACAATLGHRASDAAAGRVAGFWLAAGRPEGAIPFLLRREAWDRRSQGTAAAVEVHALLERVLRDAGVPAEDRAWAELAVRRAETAAEDGRPGDARAAAAEVLAGAWPELRARAELALGAVALRERRAPEAEQHWLRAVQLLGPSGDVGDLVLAWHWLRRLASARRDHALAAQRGAELEKALGRATTEGQRIRALLALAEYHVAEGALDRGLERAEAAAELAGRRRDVSGEATAWALVGEVAEATNDLARGREAWTLAVDLLEELGEGRKVAIARCRLALVELRDARFGACKAALEPARRLEEVDPVVNAAVHGVLLALHAARQRWPAFDRALSVCRASWPALPAHETASQRVALLAAELCVAHGDRERARAVLRLARERCVAHGDTVGAADLVKRIEAT